MSHATEIEEQAALWVLRREEPFWSASDQEELDRWLAQSDGHKVAFWRLEHGWREADRIGSIGAASAGVAQRSTATALWKPFAVAASVLLVFAGLALQQTDLPFAPNQQADKLAFETAVGGHKVVSLSDGSRVELNTDTAIEAAVDHSGRAIWLERGEAYFDIAKRPAQQFVVHSGPRTVTVLGTKFSVRRTGSQLTVAVLEGMVRVAEGAAAERSVTVAAGNVVVAGDGSTLVTRSSVEAVQELMAWRSGRLHFDDATLAQAAGQFNRYNRKQLVIGDASAAKVRIGGTFDARNVDAFGRLLRDAYGLNVRAGAEMITVSS